MARFGSKDWGNAREIPFDFAQGRLSLRLKNSCGQDDVWWDCDDRDPKLHGWRNFG